MCVGVYAWGMDACDSVVCVFGVQDPGDLTIAEGQVLTLLWKDEEEWWTVRNARGSYGLVPVKYLDKVSSKHD